MTNSNDQDDASAALHAAGWFEGRDVGEIVDGWLGRLRQDGFKPFDAAVAALREFGGIAVQQRAPGVNLARESFRIDPLVALGERDRFARFEQVLGMGLFPIGECGDGGLFLAVATDGRVFAIADAIELAGGSPREAVTNLILGVRGAAISADPPHSPTG